MVKKKQKTKEKKTKAKTRPKSAKKLLQTPKIKKISTPKKSASKKSKIKKVVNKVAKKTLIKKIVPLKLFRSNKNPIIGPSPYSWESQGVFNPGVVDIGGRIHLFYRALGSDGMSRLGYASSKDGVNFDIRLSHPVYVAESYKEAKKHWPFTSPARLTYNPSVYESGGGWGGCEDPRAVCIDGVVYMTFNMFNGWNAMRVAVTSISEDNLLNRKWLWNDFTYLSRPGERQKNWVLFPEKINGQFALFHNLDKGDPNKVAITYLDNLDSEKTPTPDEAPDPQLIPDHNVAWHFRTRSASAPPIKTKDGWLLLYHAMEKKDPHRYKVGAMLLDLKNPTKVLYRAPSPILEPDFWYENDWKPGIVYASGAVVRDGKLFVYYGGGDKYVGLATIPVKELLQSMKENKPVKLAKSKIELK